jgi:molybdenum cofactor biosynthesis enzyme
MSELSHYDESGKAKMVDISDKPATTRRAVASARVVLSPETVARLRDHTNPKGDPLEIGFNAAYLLEVLRYMPTAEVKLAFKAPERAATIEPAAKNGDEKPDYLCLVMPLRLLE